MYLVLKFMKSMIILLYTDCHELMHSEWQKCLVCKHSYVTSEVKMWLNLATLWYIKTHHTWNIQELICMLKITQSVFNK